MKKITLVILLFIPLLCLAQKAKVSDNEKLMQMYKEDQTDRQTPNIDWRVIMKRDSTRLSRAYQMLDQGMVKTGKDHYNAAMLFQHGRDTMASAMAVKMMRKAISLDSSINNWLLAAAIDRDLMRRGKPQIYGTQYVRMQGEPWKRYRIDSTAVTDEERKAYRVETLAEQREKLKRLNKKKLSDLLKSGKTLDEIVRYCKETARKESDYDLSESGINSFGYQLIAQSKMEEALKIFKLNTELYPDGYNTHDSLGECLLMLGKKEEAIKAYKKSLELNPKNDNAKRVLEKM